MAHNNEILENVGWYFQCDFGCRNGEEVASVGGILVDENDHKVLQIEPVYLGEGDVSWARSREAVEGYGYRIHTIEQTKQIIKPHFADHILRDLEYFRFKNRDNDEILEKVLELTVSEFVDNFLTGHFEGNTRVHRIMLDHFGEETTIEQFVRAEIKTIKICEWVLRGLAEKPGRHTDWLIQKAFNNYDNLDTLEYFYEEPTIEVAAETNPVFTLLKVTYDGPPGREYVRKGAVSPGQEVPEEPVGTLTLEPNDEGMIQVNIQLHRACVVWYRESTDDPWERSFFIIPERVPEEDETTES